MNKAAAGQQLPLSVAIITLNEAENLARTLESVKTLASEIVVVDSGSKDDTCHIAESYGANVQFRDWSGFVDQKNFALQCCRQPWILFLDADEVLTTEIQSSIRQAIENQQFKSYRLNRRTHYLGVLLQYSWQPDWKLHLVHADANPVWQGYDPHARLTAEGASGELEGDVIHYSYRDLQDHMLRTVRYAKTSAESYAKMNRRFSMLHLLLNPQIAFVKKYIIRRGFLDGFRGLLVALSTAWSVAMKYYFLWEISQKTDEDRT